MRFRAFVSGMLCSSMVAATVVVPAVITATAGTAEAVTCIDCGGGGSGGGGGGGGGGGTPQPPIEFFVSFPIPAPANDVASGPDGSVWIIANGGAFCASFCTRSVSFGHGGQRLAVDPSGLPWQVGFDNTIWRGNADGSLTQMPGLANDIGIGANGDVWAISTNPQNGSFQVMHLVGGAWVADLGSGQEVDVDASGHPMVNGSDGKIWIKDGGANQGWSQLTGLANDMGVKHNASLVGTGSEAGRNQSFWITGLDHLLGGHDLGVWRFDGQGTWTLVNQSTGGRTIAVDNSGTPFVVDSAGELLVGQTSLP